MKEYTVTKLGAMFFRVGFSRVRAYAEAKGRYLPIPGGFARLIEGSLGRLPFCIQKRLARALPLRFLLGVVKQTIRRLRDRPVSTGLVAGRGRRLPEQFRGLDQATIQPFVREAHTTEFLAYPFHRFGARSEERRVGKEGRSRWSPEH